MISIVVMVVAAAAVVAFLLWLGAVTGRSDGTNRNLGSGDGGGYVASPDSQGGAGHCHTSDFGGGDCGGDGGGGD